MSVLTSIANKIALISHGIVAVRFVPYLTLIADGLNLDRYVLKNCYGVGVYSRPSSACIGLNPLIPPSSACNGLDPLTLI